MDKYLIALDMDGTLLTSKRVISPNTQEYLKKLIKEGHIVVISSGRPVRGLLRFKEQLGLDTPLICFNGALIFSLDDPNFKEQKSTFSKEIILDLYNSLKPYMENAMAEIHDDIFIDKEDKILGIFFTYEGMNIHKGDFNDIIKDEVITFIFKLNEYGQEHIDEVRQIVRRYPGFDGRSWGGLPYIELYPTFATKGNAIASIAKYYHIPKDHIIAIGDSENDVFMMEASGYGVAINNAKDVLKEKADIVTKNTNDEDGIIEAIEDIFNGKYKAKSN